MEKAVIRIRAKEVTNIINNEGLFDTNIIFWLAIIISAVTHKVIKISKNLSRSLNKRDIFIIVKDMGVLNKNIRPSRKNTILEVDQRTRVGAVAVNRSNVVREKKSASIYSC